MRLLAVTVSSPGGSCRELPTSRIFFKPAKAACSAAEQAQPQQAEGRGPRAPAGEQAQAGQGSGGQGGLRVWPTGADARGP